MNLSIKFFFVVSCHVIFFTSLSGQTMNPLYGATVGGGGSGPLQRGALLVQMGVGASQRITSGHSEKIKVDSFSVAVFRDTSVVFAFKNTGNIFHKDLNLLFKKIVPGDRVLLFDINCSNLSGKKVFVEPLEYLID